MRQEQGIRFWQESQRQRAPGGMVAQAQVLLPLITPPRPFSALVGEQTQGQSRSQVRVEHGRKEPRALFAIGRGAIVGGRRAGATLLLSSGVHPKVVQEILGHSQISMIMDIYSHVLPTMQQEAMEKLHQTLLRKDVVENKKEG